MNEAACTCVFLGQGLLSKVRLKGAGKGPALFLCREVVRMLEEEEKGTSEVSLE